MKLTKLCLFLLIVFCDFFACTTGNGSDSSEEEVTTAEEPAATTGTAADSLQKSKDNLFEGAPPDYHLFIETSGSMDGYYAPATSTLNATLTQLVTQLDNSKSDGLLDDLHFAYLGSGKMQPKTENLLKVFNRKFNKGSQIKLKSSEFDHLFDTVLNHVSRSDVAILVSDLIFSPPRKEANQIRNFLQYQNGTLNRMFDARLDTMNLETLIIQCSGLYDGIYWDNQYEKIPLNNVQRPYYIAIVGDSQYLRQFIRTIDVTRLPGFRNSWLLAASNHSAVKAKVGYNLKYRRGSDYQPVAKLSIGNAVEGENNEFQFPVLVNLDEWSLNESGITDRSNYKLSAQSSNYQVADIVKLTDADMAIKANNGYTHLLVLKTKKLRPRQDIEVAFNNKMPAWINASSTDDDSHTGTDTTQMSATFGLSSLLGGIFNAYEEKSKNRPLFSFKIHVEK